MIYVGGGGGGLQIIKGLVKNCVFATPSRWLPMSILHPKLAC